MTEKYSAVMELGRHSKVTLLRNPDSGDLAVRRIVDMHQVTVYRELKRIVNSHVPAIYDISVEENGEFEILEEYIEGQTLGEILQERGSVPEPEAVIYIMQLCDVLDRLHHAGLVHRDIKPDNIIISPQNGLYLIDFDIARMHKKEKASDTEFLGTQGYAAPEQFGFRQTNEQTDIYAAGVLLNKLLTGKTPQEFLTEGRLRGIICRCTEMDARRRYRSAKALKRALRPYLPKGHPQGLNFLRQIPGFRSFTPWKMAAMGGIYVFLLLCLIVGVLETGTGFCSVLELAVSCIYYVLLWFFLFDSFQIRSRILWLEKSRGRGSYLLKCILLAVTVLLAVSIGGQWLTDVVENFMAMYVGSIPNLTQRLL